MAYFRSDGRRYADEPVFEPEPFEVIVLSGLPASGKSHWADRNPHLPQVSYDLIREELGIKQGRGVGTVVHAADDRMRKMLRTKTPFVVNATHLSRQMRQRTLDRIHDYGGSVRMMYFEAPKSELLARNTARSSSLPNTKLLSMATRWEVPGLTEVDFLEAVLA